MRMTLGFALTLLVALGIGQTDVRAHTSIEFRKVTTGGTMKWLGNTLMPCGLPDDHTCKVTVSTPTSSGVLTPYGSGYILEATVSGLLFTQQGGEGQLGTSGANFTFGADYEIKIVSSDEYPSLNGRQVTLNGISTNSSGLLSVYFP